MTIPESVKLIHEKTVALSRVYKQSEADLLEAIIEVRENKIYRYFDCTSVFEYCVKILSLDAGLVYGFTAVAKKIKEIPELKAKIKAGNLNVSTAKRITAVLTDENKNEWFQKAETLSTRKLEKEVANANPKLEVKERASYLNSKRVRLELGLDEKLMLKLRHIQDLESQKKRHSVSLEDVLSVIAENYLSKNDPVEKAKRAKIRGRLHEQTMPAGRALTQPVENPSTCKKSLLATPVRIIPSTSQPQPERTPIPKQIIHQVHLHDKGECQHMKLSHNNRPDPLVQTDMPGDRWAKSF